MAKHAFDEWLTERLHIERTTVLAVMLSQFQTSHEALQAEILEKLYQPLHMDLEAALLRGCPDAPTLYVDRPKTPEPTAAKPPIVQGSPVRIIVEPHASPGVTHMPMLKDSPASILRCQSDTTSANSSVSADEIKQKSCPPSWHRWEAIFGATILLNAIVLLVEEQYRGLNVGFILGVKGFNEPAHEIFPFAATMFDVLSVFFTLLFTFELVFRIYHERLGAFKSLWVWFDTIVVLGSWMSVFNVSSGLGSWLMRLRVLRVVRLFALVELMECFEKLHLMIRSIKASAVPLMWCMLLIMFTQVVAALCLHFFLAGVYDDASVPESTRLKIFERFGTTARTILTMFQVIFANWAEPCWLLVLNVNEWYGLFFVLYRCVLGFALLRVVSAMFIAETHKISKDDTVMADLKKKNDAEKHKKDLRQLFREVDASGDGKVSWWEMQHMLKNHHQLLSWVKKMGFKPLHLSELFKIIRKGGERVEDGHAIVDELVSEMLKVEGQASSLDVLAVAKAVERLNAKLDANEMQQSIPFASIMK